MDISSSSHRGLEAEHRERKCGLSSCSPGSLPPRTASYFPLKTLPFICLFRGPRVVTVWGDYCIVLTQILYLSTVFPRAKQYQHSLDKCVLSTPFPFKNLWLVSGLGSFRNQEPEFRCAEWQALPIRGDNGSIDLLTGSGPVHMLQGQLADRLVLIYNRWLFPMFHKRRGIHSRQGDYLFSHRKGHVLPRGQA